MAPVVQHTHNGVNAPNMPGMMYLPVGMTAANVQQLLQVQQQHSMAQNQTALQLHEQQQHSFAALQAAQQAAAVATAAAEAAEAAAAVAHGGSPLLPNGAHTGFPKMTAANMAAAAAMPGAKPGADPADLLLMLSSVAKAGGQNAGLPEPAPTKPADAAAAAATAAAAAGIPLDPVTIQRILAVQTAAGGTAPTPAQMAKAATAAAEDAIKEEQNSKPKNQKVTSVVV